MAANLITASTIAEPKDWNPKGPSINDVRFLAHFLTYLPTPVRFCPNIDFQFYYMVSDFGKSTYLPKNRTSFMDFP